MSDDNLLRCRQRRLNPYQNLTALFVIISCQCHGSDRDASRRRLKKKIKKLVDAKNMVLQPMNG